jgi:hypothetical protein
VNPRVVAPLESATQRATVIAVTAAYATTYEAIPCGLGVCGGISIELPRRWRGPVLVCCSERRRCDNRQHSQRC